MDWGTHGRRPEDPYFRVERLLRDDNRPAEVEALVHRVLEIKLKNSRSLVRVDGVKDRVEVARTATSKKPGEANRQSFRRQK